MTFERRAGWGWQALSLFFCVSAAAGQTLPSPLSEQAAVEIALTRRNELAAAKHAIAVSAGAVTQAGLRQNPMFSVQTENWRFSGEPGFSAGRDLDFFAFMSQTIETGGKRDRRLELGRQGQATAEMAARAAEFRIRQNVRGAYWRARAADAKRRLLAENRDHFGRIVTFHQVRFENGAIAEADVIKVRLERERLSAAAETAAMEAERAQIDLLAEMGWDDLMERTTLAEPGSAAGLATPAARPELPPTSELVALAMQSRIEIALATRAIERAKAQTELARANAKPNVTPYLGYKRTNSFNTLIGGVTVPLPFFDRNQGQIAAHLAEADQAEAELRAVRARVSAAVAAAVTAVARRSAIVRSIESGMLDNARETARIALAAYTEGGSDLFRLLDAERAQKEIELLHNETLFQWKLSEIDLDSAVGKDVAAQSRGVHRAAN
jgi:cobalt-zinc-cadmium efflux system outer membrane protein